MAEEPQLSKRERQKQRRDARREAQMQASRRSRRNRFIALTAIALVVLGAIGAWGWSLYQEDQEEEALAERAAAVRETAGCTPTNTDEEKQADQGAGHLDQQSLPASPPEVLYPDRPATSGRHLPNWVITGVYDKQIDERLLVHNLEHGYVVYYYDEGLDDEQVEALRTFAEEQIDGDLQKIVVAPWEGELPNDANFAATAWTNRVMCESFDEDVALDFARRHHGGEGEAPEAFLRPHLTERDGIDPGAAEGPILFPPLGTSAAGTPSPDASPSPGEDGDAGASEPAEDAETAEPAEDASPAST